MSYSEPTVSAVYRFPAATLSSAAVIGRIQGPSGMTGTLVDVSVIVTTGVTVAANTIDVGTSADPDAAGTLTVPVSAANSGTNGATLVEGAQLVADGVVEVSTNGECTAGAADVLVAINWS